uniref:Fic family protein n=1 Tax=Flintibacter muris TaxID=2941327 RepID=UPI0020403829
LAEEIADFYHTVNMLHPFREGNGRAQRVFFTQWIRSLGCDFDLSPVDPDAFMIATVYAAQGVMDQLVDFFEQTIERPQMGMRMN